MTPSRPPPEHCMSSKYAENCLDIKHGAVDIHLSQWSAIDGPIHMVTPRADVIWVGYQSTSDTLHPLWHQWWFGVAVNGQRTAQGYLIS